MSASSRFFVAEGRQPLVKFAALQSVVRAEVSGLLGYPDPVDASPFPADRDGVPSALSPAVLRRRVHPLVRFTLLQSTSGKHPLELPRAPLVGSVPSSRRRPEESTCTGRPVPDFVPSSAFRALSTVCSSSCLARLFRRAAMSRVLAPGVRASDRAVPPRGGRSPLAVGAAASRLLDASERRVDLRVFVPIGIRGVTRVPSCDFQLPRAGSRDLGSAVALPPLATFTGGTHVLRRLVLSVSIDPWRSPLSPEVLPVRAFRASRLHQFRAVQCNRRRPSL